MSGRCRSSRISRPVCSARARGPAALHRREQRDPRPAGEDALDQREVRQVVLDVEHRRARRAARAVRRAGALGAPAEPRPPAPRRAAARPRTCCPRRGRLSTRERAAHRLDEPLRQRQPEAGALDARCSAPSRSNGVNSRSSLSAAMPARCRSRRSARARPRRSTHDTVDACRPAGCTSPRSTAGSAAPAAAAAGRRGRSSSRAGGLDPSVDAARRRRAAARGPSRCGTASSHRHRLERQPQPPGLDPGDVQHLVDQAEQVPAAA